MKKSRGQGEGNIYKRQDGRWAGRASTGFANGRRARRWVYGETRADVAKKLRLLIQGHQDGTLPTSGRVTVAQFLNRWLEDSAKAKLRPRTFLSYAQVVRLHILPTLGPVQLQRLSPQQLQGWVNTLVKNGLSARTCQYARAILRSALGQALRWGVVSRNVATLVDVPRMVRHEIQPLQPDQARKLLEIARDDRLCALFTVALALGLRQGEALGLQWEDIDMPSGVLHVRKSLQRIGGTWALVEPKSTRSRRTVSLPEVVRAALGQHRVRQLQERLLAGGRWQESGFVFTTRIGTPIEPSNLTKTFQALLVKAGLRHIRFHDLRHTAATFLLAQGVDARTIMETLGHSQISLTLNTYSHVLPTLQANAAVQMDILLSARK